MIESENPDPFEDEEDEDKYRLQARPSGLGFVQDSVMHRIDAFLSEKHVSSGVGMNFVERIDHFLSGGLGLSESSGKEMGIEGFAGTGRFMDKSECDCDDCDDCDCSGLDESEGPKYEGPALEKGGTSIAGKAAPAVREMLGTQVKAGMKVLDYGAGSFGRLVLRFMPMIRSGVYQGLMVGRLERSPKFFRRPAQTSTSLSPPMCSTSFQIT